MDSVKAAHHCGGAIEHHFPQLNGGEIGMDWRIKGAVQGILSRVPYGSQCNDLLRRLFLGGTSLEREIDTKVVADWLVAADLLREVGIPLEGRTLLEIGSGWYPTLPTCFHLAGAARCYTYDVEAHLDEASALALVDRLGQHLERIAEFGGRPLHEVQAAHARLSAATSVNAMLGLADIDYRAPADAAVSGLPDQSVDVVFSNSVLEHVTPTDLDRLMKECLRVLRVGGVALHSVNCGDHYAYFDRDITPINYLRYSEAEWRLWNNSIQYQNRLRPVDFIESAQSAGFDLVVVKQRPRLELLERLPESEIAPEFGHYDREQLCTTSVDFVVRR